MWLKYYKLNKLRLKRHLFFIFRWKLIVLSVIITICCDCYLVIALFHLYVLLLKPLLLGDEGVMCRFTYIRDKGGG